jgi:membrane-bound lytic murein transglycosylase D
MVARLIFIIFFINLSFSVLADSTILTLRNDGSKGPIKLSTSTYTLDDFKNDPLALVSDTFNIPEPFYEATSFWFSIYTNFTTDQVVLHHRDHPSIIFHVVDATNLIDRARANTIQRGRRELASLFDHLSANNGSCAGQTSTINCVGLVELLKKSKLVPPSKKSEIAKYYKALKKSIRSQSGQRDMILQGIQNLIPFESKISRIFTLFDVPGELLAIAFLESSFNTKARSTAGAAGVWQFIRTTGSQYFAITQKHDDRLNPLISTLGALQFLKQNYKTTGQWDLAIWSYNSGLRHVLDARKKHIIDDLHTFFSKYKHRSIGFASRSFYPSFLALVYALSYKKTIYIDRTKTPFQSSTQIDTDNIKFYVFLCNTSPKFIFDSLSKTSPELMELNSHLHKRYHSTKLPRGTIFVSDRPLTNRKYFEVPEKNYTS